MKERVLFYWQTTKAYPFKQTRIFKFLFIWWFFSLIFIKIIHYRLTPNLKLSLFFRHLFSELWRVIYRCQRLDKLFPSTSLNRKLKFQFIYDLFMFDSSRCKILVNIVVNDLLKYKTFVWNQQILCKMPWFVDDFFFIRIWRVLYLCSIVYSLELINWHWIELNWVELNWIELNKTLDKSLIL